MLQRAGLGAQWTSKKLPRAVGNQSIGQECSQGFWANSLYCAKGMGLPREGTVGRENSGCWSLRFGQVRRESSWAGRVGNTAFGSGKLRWKVPVHSLAQ